MYKKYLLIILILPLLALTGCVQQFKYNIKQVQSDVFGLNREVTVYSLDGKPIKTIEGKFKVLYPSETRMEFIKDNGKKTTVSGYYSAIIEEK